MEVVPSRLADVGDAILRMLTRLGSALRTVARRDKLEAVSVVLLGIGGAIFQPIWLVGALIAVSSRKWDLRDKWLGLALPVVAVVVGTALAITFGAQLSGYRGYLEEAWVAAGRLSRIAAFLGALYLLVRIYRLGGERPKRLPPWMPHARQRRRRRGR